MTHPPFAARNLFAPAAVIAAMLSGLSACSTTAPGGTASVTPFDIHRYQGTWYEIACIDHSLESGLNDGTANYRLQLDGRVEVINRGYDTRRNDRSPEPGEAPVEQMDCSNAAQ